MSNYRNGFAEAIAAIGVSLEPAVTVTNRARAQRAGKMLAEQGDFSGMTEDQIVSALGKAWVEMGKDYPKALGIALISQRIDPDDAAARGYAVRAIHYAHNAELYDNGVAVPASSPSVGR